MINERGVDEADYLLTPRTVEVTFKSTAGAARQFNMLGGVLIRVCLSLLWLELTICQDVTPTPIAFSQEAAVEPTPTPTPTKSAIAYSEGTATPPAAAAEVQPLKLPCPNDNEDHFVSTGWYACSNGGRVGLYRIDKNKTVLRYKVSDPGFADAHNVTSDGALLVTPRDCSKDRVYMCDRWAKVGRQNQCWMFTVRNCTVRMSVNPKRQCSCSTPRSVVTSDAAHLTMACNLMRLAIVLLTIIGV